MNLNDITNAVITVLNRDYYLVPRKMDMVNFNKLEFVESVTSFVCNFRGVSTDLVKSDTRRAEFTHSRYIIYYLVRKYSKVFIDQQFIASLFGRDRTSVYQGLCKLDAMLQVDRQMKREVNEVEEAFLQHNGKYDRIL